MSTPSTARMYDYYLGGKDNFAVDREAAERALKTSPQARTAMLANRGFLVGAVGRAAAAGIDQFLDLGTGIPTSPSVHEVARETHPGARVVYVDNDPVVTAHNKALCAVDEGIGVIEGDIRDPAGILDHPETGRLIDFERPVAVLAVAVLHMVTHENPERIVAALAERMTSGSYLVVSVSTSEGWSDDERRAFREVYAGTTAGGADLVEPGHIDALFPGFTLLDPGLAPVWQWCDDPEMATPLVVRGGIGVKP